MLVTLKKITEIYVIEIYVEKKEAVFVIICDWFKFVFLRAGERDACDKLFIHCSYFGITKAI